ncbi:MAG TPA: nitronate monooxygenase [Acidimicrobiales bacterium]|nr:nitronate monooxygenase [Acidimicrobiales bacterium]
MIRTRFTQQFGLEHPVMSAPMALHSGGTLAGAVTAAGGFGAFGGMAPGRDPAWIHDEVAKVRSVTDGPFAVGFITAFLSFARPLLDAVLEDGPAAIALSFGDPRPYLPAVRDAGAAVICQVQTLADAAIAVDSGADVLVVQGNEAGGHTGTMGLLSFVALAAERFPDTVLLAAGGIADGRTLAGALLAGADGAWVGTSLLATHEAVEVSDAHKAAVVASDGGDTVYTRAFDLVSGLPWPEGIAERVGRNAVTDEWAGRELELAARRTEVTVSEPHRYGPAAGFVDGVRPAGEVVRRLSAEAEAVLRTRAPGLLA